MGEGDQWLKKKKNCSSAPAICFIAFQLSTCCGQAPPWAFNIISPSELFDKWLQVLTLGNIKASCFALHTKRRHQSEVAPKQEEERIKLSFSEPDVCSDLPYLFLKCIWGLWFPLPSPPSVTSASCCWSRQLCSRWYLPHLLFVVPSFLWQMSILRWPQVCCLSQVAEIWVIPHLALTIAWAQSPSLLSPVPQPVFPEQSFSPSSVHCVFHDLLMLSDNFI